MLVAPKSSRPVTTLTEVQTLKQGALIHTLGVGAQAWFGFRIARIKYPQKIIYTSVLRPDPERRYMKDPLPRRE
jgi:hypothetical protein